MRSTLGLLTVFFLLTGTGCLKTRSEINKAEQSHAMQDRVSVLQTQLADRNVEFEQVHDELRRLSGRIELLEAAERSKDQDSAEKRQGLEAQVNDMGKQLALMEQEMTKLIGSIDRLQQDVRKAQASGSSSAASSSGAEQGNFAGAQAAFRNKNWRDAILGYEKYRELNPKGRSYAEATYKIGFSFQELKMIPEARAFYEEVIAKFPNTDWAKQGRARLQKL